MGEVAILPPQDVLKDVPRHHQPRTRPHVEAGQTPSPKPGPNSKKSSRRKRCPERKTNNGNHRTKDEEATPCSNSPPKPVAGWARIPKRGEKLTPSKYGRRGVTAADEKNIAGFYAGTTFESPPPPSSLPRPPFFTKKGTLETADDDTIDDLVEILRLDFA